MCIVCKLKQEESKSDVCSAALLFFTILILYICRVGKLCEAKNVIFLWIFGSKRVKNDSNSPFSLQTFARMFLGTQYLYFFPNLITVTGGTRKHLIK